MKQNSLSYHIDRIDETNTYDGAMPCIITFPEKLMIVYRQSKKGHADSTGRIVARFSYDSGQTWSDASIIINIENYDTAAPSVFYRKDESSLILFVQARDNKTITDNSESPYKDLKIFKLLSYDEGENWSSPVEITDKLLLTRPHPFGGGVYTDNGYMTCFYNSLGEKHEKTESSIESIFYKPGKESFYNQTIVAQTNKDNPKLLTEPQPLALDREKIIIFGRELITADFYAIKSNDGGSTWEEPIYFNPLNSSISTPIWTEKNNSTVFYVWGDRDKGKIVLTYKSIEEVWNNPGNLNEPFLKLHDSKCTDETISYWKGTAGDFGYPSLNIDPIDTDTLHLSFYDGSKYPDIWYGKITDNR